jgi:hypothetical protein
MPRSDSGPALAEVRGGGGRRGSNENEDEPSSPEEDDENEHGQLGWFSPDGVGAELMGSIFGYVASSKVRAVEVFYSVDTDGSGALDLWEFQAALRMMRIQVRCATPCHRDVSNVGCLQYA